LFGPIFTVQNIQILRNDNITEMSLSYSSVENIREKRIVNLDEQVIENKMKEYQNNIKDVDISFNLPDTVKIKLTSYPIYFNTTLNNKSYYVTQN
jgi:cell division septal protein FtsQ